MAAHRVQPTSDMIICRCIRARSAGVAVAEIRGAQLGQPSVVEAELLARVPELERRVVVAAVLVVDDPQPLAVVEVVLGEQVVVAGDRRERRGRRGPPRSAGPGRGAPGSRPGIAIAALVDEREVALRQPDHVEVVAEARPGVQPAEGRGDPCGHARRAEGRVRHRPGRRATRGRRRPTRAARGGPCGADPGAAAARVLCSSLPRSTASSSVAAPGIRTKTARAVHLDPVVRVGQPGRDRLPRGRSARPSRGSRR